MKAQIWVLLLGGLGLSYGLDVWAHHDQPVNFYLAIFGALTSYIYSAPPLKLKQSGWIGNYALGASYISLPWWAGQALFGTLDWKVVAPHKRPTHVHFGTPVFSGYTDPRRPSFLLVSCPGDGVDNVLFVGWSRHCRCERLQKRRR